MTTMKDVADRADVSVTTVSHVINKSRYVSPELEERVQEAIRELDYRPNLVARSLRQSRTQTLGMVVPDNANPYFAEIARKIEDACFDLGFSLILCNTDQNPEREREYIDLLVEKHVDGLLFVSSGGQSEYLQTAVEREIPIILVDRRVPNIRCDQVLVDNETGGRLATKHLFERGHTRIACITGPSDVTPSGERVQGYHGALTNAGLAVDEELIKRGDFRPATGYSAMKELLSIRNKPTAVFACNDLMAFGAIRALREKEMRIPDDVAVVGFDNIPLASYTYPSLTTVAQPIEDMGKTAAELLVQRIEEQEYEPQTYLFDTELVIRQTS